jgi:hypothetical protein
MKRVIGLVHVPMKKEVVVVVAEGEEGEVEVEEEVGERVEEVEVEVVGVVVHLEVSSFQMRERGKWMADG